MNELEEFERGIILTRHKVRMMAIVSAALSLALIAVEHCLLTRFAATCNGIVPLLSGAPQFAVLTLIVALAAYLRSVRNNAIDLRDLIRQGEVKSYPLHGTRFEFSRKKMVLLDEVANYMSIAGPYFIWLIVIVAARITCESFLRFVGSDLQCIRGLFIWDTLIALWMLIGLAFLAVTHFSARRKDEEIRVAARRQENEALSYSNNKDAKEPQGES